MTIQPADQLPIYSVVGVTPGQYSQDPAGNPVRGRMVHVRLADGTPDEVFVPDAQWPDNAQAMIEASVKALSDVRYLTNKD